MLGRVCLSVTKPTPKWPDGFSVSVAAHAHDAATTSRLGPDGGIAEAELGATRSLVRSVRAVRSLREPSRRVTCIAIATVASSRATPRHPESPETTHHD